MRDNFYQFLKRIQRHYWKLHQIISLMKPNKNFCKYSHDRLRCRTTRDVLSEIFIRNKKETNLQTYESNYNDIIITLISLVGDSFPNHSFMVIEHKGEKYLLQSYWYEYLFSGKYGLQKLTIEEYERLEQILNIYEENKEYPDYELIDEANTIFSHFTGIDFNKHPTDISTRKNVKDNLLYSTFVFEEEEFFNGLKHYFDNIYDWVINFQEKNFDFDFKYFIYDAFIDGSICSSASKFEILTGINKKLFKECTLNNSQINIDSKINLSILVVKNAIIDINKNIEKFLKNYSSPKRDNSFESPTSKSFGKY